MNKIFPISLSLLLAVNSSIIIATPVESEETLQKGASLLQLRKQEGQDRDRDRTYSDGSTNSTIDNSQYIDDDSFLGIKGDSTANNSGISTIDSIDVSSHDANFQDDEQKLKEKKSRQQHSYFVIKFNDFKKRSVNILSRLGLFKKKKNNQISIQSQRILDRVHLENRIKELENKRNNITPGSEGFYEVTDSLNRLVLEKDTLSLEIARSSFEFFLRELNLGLQRAREIRQQREDSGFEGFLYEIMQHPLSSEREKKIGQLLELEEKNIQYSLAQVREANKRMKYQKRYMKSSKKLLRDIAHLNKDSTEDVNAFLISLDQEAKKLHKIRTKMYNKDSKKYAEQIHYLDKLLRLIASHKFVAINLLQKKYSEN